jgi:hypothetical protein
MRVRAALLGGCIRSGTGVSPVSFESNGRDARATTRFMDKEWRQCRIAPLLALRLLLAIEC